MADLDKVDTQDQGLFDGIKGAKILVVGDLPQVSDAFTEAGYDTVSNALKADDIPPHLLREWRLSGGPCLVILSVILPDGDPFELCRKFTQDNNKVLVVMVGSDGENEWKGFHAGTADYVPDTASIEILFYRCERVLAESRFRDHVEKSVRSREKMFVNILQVMAKSIEARDAYTMHHSEDVAKYARILARKIGWSEDRIRRIGIAGLLHDIGKIGVPEELLTKPGPLTEEEYEIFKKHSLISIVILDPIVELKGIIEIIKHHHEWYDGSGYPDGLKGNDIPLGARIVHIADAYESMLSQRVYRKVPLSKEDALEELRCCAGTQFDPELTRAFIEIEGKGLVRTPLSSEK